MIKMLYNTTITSCAGGVYIGSNGERLISIGRQNVHVGKNVYTDGKIIYGYDIPQTLQRKVIRKKKVVNYVLTYVDSSVYGGKISGLRYLDIDKYAEDNEKSWYDGELTVPTNTDGLIVAGNKLYYIIENDDDTVTIGDVNGEEATISTSSFGYHYFVADAGKNGGIIITGGSYSSYSGRYMYNGDIIYISPDMRHVVTVPEQNDDEFISPYGHWNVDEDGKATCTVYYEQIDQEGYVRDRGYKTLTIFSSGGYSLNNYHDPILGDGVAHFEENPSTGGYYNTGTLDFDFDDNNSLTLPITVDHTATIVGDYVFIYSAYPQRSVFQHVSLKQYNKEGTLLRDYSTGYDPDMLYYFNNYKIIACDPIKLAKSWGFVED